MNWAATIARENNNFRKAKLVQNNEGKMITSTNINKKILTAIFILIICLSITLAYSSLFAETISYFRYHIVKGGETLYGISEHYGVTWEEIKEKNNLSGSKIYPGQKLIIPVKVQGVYHAIKKYESLWRISKTYGVSQKEICRLNHISDPTQIKIGQRLFIPGVKKVKEIEIPEELIIKKEKDFPEETISIPEEPAIAEEETVAVSEQMVTWPESIDTLQRSKEDEALVDKMTSSLIWPLKGEIIKYFGEGSFGIDISAPEGTTIVAPADGKVIFSGWSKWLGKTLIIKHSHLGIWTCYTHNSLNLVEIDNVVNRGDPIAKIGSTGWAECTVLHFEVRGTDGEPVNPLNYLP